SLPAVHGAVYVATEGPRFETPAEIRAYRKLGGDVVGMTGVPEVVLARELNLCYAVLGFVTNWAAGMAPKALDETELSERMQQMTDRVNSVLEQALPRIASLGQCSCT
ncbi:MAG: S-methyl-5'-thioadenosine phosphorylase, partial [Firmicutes bacterium]|nr:S-methyl-5'-thioadenosine phosphorylase [Bacillota bacterium]